MKRIHVLPVLAACALAVGLLGPSASARPTADVDIVQTATAAGQFTTLASLLTKAGLVDTLAGPGPFTVFAPTNAAFAKLPPGTVESLVQPQNKPTLTKILTYHVVPGTYTAKDLMGLVKQGGGQAELKTAAGQTLTVMQKGKRLFVADDKGNTARVTIGNVMQSNGVIHVIDTVLMP